MAGYLKEKDPNHLVTVGLEGFWGAHAEEAREFNPLPGENGQLSWTSLTGQNFTAQHSSPHIDFCGAHYWPDLWVRSYILTHYIQPQRPGVAYSRSGNNVCHDVFPYHILLHAQDAGSVGELGQQCTCCECHWTLLRALYVLLNLRSLQSLRDSQWKSMRRQEVRVRQF